MREYDIVYNSEILAAGIRRGDKANRNSKALIAASDVVCEPGGLEAFPLVSQIVPFGAELQYPVEGASYPWPQLIVGREVTLLCYDTAIYAIDKDDPPTTAEEWEQSRIVVRLATSIDLEYDLDPSSEPWDFVDMGPAWILVRPDIQLVKHNLEETHLDNIGPLGHGGNYVLALSTDMLTAVYHRGRVIYGGMDVNTSWLVMLFDLFNQLYPEVPEPFKVITNFYDMKDNWVGWTGIGAEDLWGIFLPQLALGGVLTEWNPELTTAPFMDMLRKNEFGLMPTETQGQILRVKPLGDNIVAYGSEGITLLTPIQRPYPTFGSQLLLKTGIASRGAVGGNDGEHVFITNVGDTFKLTGDGLQMLGYRHVFSEFVDDEFRISYDDAERRFYINTGGDALTLYLLSPSGLSAASGQKGLTSAFRVDGALVGVATDLSYTLSRSYITTDWIDFGNRGVKTLVLAELGGYVNEEAAVYVKICSRYHDSTIYNSGSIAVRDALVDPHADTLQARVQFSGVEFRVEFMIKTNTSSPTKYPFDGIEIDYIRVGYQQNDRRHRRGADVG